MIDRQTGLIRIFLWLIHDSSFGIACLWTACAGEGWYVPMVRKLAPGAQVWAGEDGPIGGGEDGTCGAVLGPSSSKPHAWTQHSRLAA